MKKILLFIFAISILSVFDVCSQEPSATLNTIENTNSFNVYVQGDVLIFKNIENGSVIEIYNTLGTKVQTSVVESGRVSISELNKGIYIVKAGKYSKKIIIQ